jgi:hypothetical protein
MLVLSALDNRVRFIASDHTWINGPGGLVRSPQRSEVRVGGRQAAGRIPAERRLLHLFPPRSDQRVRDRRLSAQSV